MGASVQCTPPSFSRCPHSSLSILASKFAGATYALLPSSSRSAHVVVCPAVFPLAFGRPLLHWVHVKERLGDGVDMAPPQRDDGALALHNLHPPTAHQHTLRMTECGCTALPLAFQEHRLYHNAQRALSGRESSGGYWVPVLGVGSPHSTFLYPLWKLFQIAGVQHTSFVPLTNVTLNAPAQLSSECTYGRVAVPFTPGRLRSVKVYC